MVKPHMKRTNRDTPLQRYHIRKDTIQQHFSAIVLACDTSWHKILGLCNNSQCYQFY